MNRNKKPNDTLFMRNTFFKENQQKAEIKEFKNIPIPIFKQCNYSKPNSKT